MAWSWGLVMLCILAPGELDGTVFGELVSMSAMFF